MKVARSRLVDPDANALYGILAVTLSFLVFAYSSNFGQISILAYYAVWLPLVAVDYRHALGDYRRFAWIIAFCILALLSTFWSDAPSVSLRASIQYSTNVFCALIASRTISIRTLTRGALTGIAVVLAYSVAFGGYEYDVLDGTYSFVGAFSSKNQLGFFASLGVYFAFASIVLQRDRGLWRLVSAGVGFLSILCLAASQSATSVLSVFAALMVAAVFWVFLNLSPKQRKGTFAVGIVLVVGLVLVALSSGIVDLVLGAFGKDSTLTGRTYLWATGLDAAQQAPILGLGYQAYWVQGFSEAERLWFEFYIPARTGFHFHNTYIEVYVELGLVGVALLLLILVTVLVGHLRRLLSERRNLVSLVLIGLLAMLLVRSFLEIDVMTPYTVGSFLLYYACGLLATRQARRTIGSRQHVSLTFGSNGLLR